METLETETGSPKERTEWSKKERGCLGCSILLLIFSIGLIIQIIWVPNALKKTLQNTISDQLYMTQKQKDKNTNQFKKWQSNTKKETPFVLFTYHLFNITNPNEILLGKWPKLKEIGPFKYRQIATRTNPIFDSKSCVVNFTWFFNWQFLESESFDKNAKITFINPIMLSIFYTSIYSNNTILKTIAQQTLSGVSGSNLFTTLEAWRLFRGFNTPWFENINPSVSPNDTWFRILPFGESMTLYTGNCNKNNAAELIKINGDKRLFMWRYPEYINGTREVKFWPYGFVKKSKPLFVYSGFSFRKETYNFEKVVKTKGIRLWRYRLSDNTFLNAANYPLNNKYYQNGENGLLNFTFLSPNPLFSYLSLKNFYDAPYYYTKYGIPTGVKQTGEAGVTFDIEPKSGFVMGGKAEIMSSVLLYRPGQFGFVPNPFMNINSSEVLVAWYNVEVNVNVPDSLKRKFSSRLDAMKTINLFSKIIWPVLGGFIILVTIGVWGYYIKKEKKNLGYRSPKEKPQSVRSTSAESRSFFN